ncbi:hypothetical protein M0802_008259 [Mischocyttarus mexicanus]|nr:hypothetical protein M0802_008259 [Mischocyttarus mexicanus]
MVSRAAVGRPCQQAPAASGSGTVFLFLDAFRWLFRLRGTKEPRKEPRELPVNGTTQFTNSDDDEENEEDEEKQGEDVGTRGPRGTTFFDTSIFQMCCSAFLSCFIRLAQHHLVHTLLACRMPLLVILEFYYSSSSLLLPFSSNLNFCTPRLLYNVGLEFVGEKSFPGQLD